MRFLIAIAVAAAGALQGAPALAQPFRDARDDTQRQVEHERHRASHRRAERRNTQDASKVGAPNPYEPKVGAPNPYATQGGTPNPYATQGGEPARGGTGSPQR